MSSQSDRMTPGAQPGSREDYTRELCGKHIGDRRVRVQRPPRKVTEKLVSMVRRTLSR